jgi:hypothetical protein
MFEDLRDNNQIFSGMFCRFPATVTIGYGDRTAQIPAELHWQLGTNALGGNLVWFLSASRFPNTMNTMQLFGSISSDLPQADLSECLIP